MFKLFSWNCRGAGNESFRCFFKKYRLDHNPCMAVILEPKISGIKANEVIKAIGLEFSHRVKAGFKGEFE